MIKRIIRHDGKFYDLGTSNKSFVRLANDLKTIGVKNFYFMLEIKDTSLCNVDPHARDENGKTTLTKDQINRIILECAKNPWYYLREVVRVKESGSSEGVPYIANRGNIAQAWLTLNNIDSWLCLPRQQGKTISALTLINWIYSYGSTQSSFIFINKDGELAKTNLRRLGDLIDALPEYMRFESLLEEDGKVVKERRNATYYKHPVSDNDITVKSKAVSYDAALSMARGLTAPVIHFDEPEFTNYIDDIVKNSVSSFETAHRKSIANNATTARIFTSTPGDLGTKSAQQASTILKKTIRWNDSMYDKGPDYIRESIRRNDSNGIVYIEYQYYQIGLDNEWLKTISNKIGDPLTVKREILLQRLQGSSNSPYQREYLEYISDTMQKPVDTIFLRSYYQMDIYKELKKNIPYIVGIDCSTGTVEDHNAITILDPYTVRPVAELACSYIGETEYEQLIIELVRDYIPKAVVVVERNSVGDGIIDHLLNSPIANRLYYDKARNLMEEKMKESESTESILKAKAKLKTTYGVYTSDKSRETMFAILSRHVAEKKDDFITTNIITDLNNLIVTPSGKIQARPGEHDDSIMSYLMCLYVYYHGNNLASFGFYKTDIVDDTELNSGIDYTRLRDVLPEDVVRVIEKEQEELESLSYEQMLRNAIETTQRESYRASKSNTLNLSNLFGETRDDLLMDDDDGFSDMSLFDDLNGF